MTAELSILYKNEHAALSHCRFPKMLLPCLSGDARLISQSCHLLSGKPNHVFRSSDPDTAKPSLHGIPGSSRFKPPALCPLHGVRAEGMKIGGAGANPAAMRGTERNNGLFRKIVAFQKRTDNPGSLPVPYRIIKCSLPLEPSEKTGFNAMQKCVLCSFYLISDSAVTRFLIFHSTIRHIFFQIPALHG